MNTARRRHNRLLLSLLALIFLVPPLLAALLYFGGWVPARTRNAGELVRPPLGFADLILARADGELYAWRPEARIWRIVVTPPDDCGRPCLELTKTLRLVWQLQGRDAARVEVLWFGSVPSGAPVYPAFVPMQLDSILLARLDQVPSGAPAADAASMGTASLEVRLIDPHGFLVMRYAPGFDAAGLRADLARLLR